MGRLPPLEMTDLTAEQRRVAEEIAATRGIARGPFEVWLRSPEMADRAQKLGAFARYQTSLPKRLTELVILITARLWTAQFEWAVHEAEARRAGVPEPVIAAIKAGQRPAALQEDEAAIYDFVHELYATRAMSQGTYDRAHGLLGTQALVELVGVIGYYGLISMTLNVFDCDTPDGKPALAPLPRGA
jgi:4-carboxymuconolactone decarboxylase